MLVTTLTFPYWELIHYAIEAIESFKWFTTYLSLLGIDTIKLIYSMNSYCSILPFPIGNNEKNPSEFVINSEGLFIDFFV